MKPCIDWRGRGFSFFKNTDCEFFPCHDTGTMDDKNFNCLFCFCPLYEHEDCGGTFTVLKNGCKDCSACVIPHDKENYGLIVERLRCADMRRKTFIGKGDKNVV